MCFFSQTQEVQKAMDEKRFEEAVKLRGRYSMAPYAGYCNETHHFTSCVVTLNLCHVLAVFIAGVLKTT